MTKVLFFLFLIFLLFSYFYTKKKELIKTNNINEINIEEKTQKEMIQTWYNDIDTTDWLAYIDKDKKYTIKYPKYLKLLKVDNTEVKFELDIDNAWEWWMDSLYIRELKWSLDWVELKDPPWWIYLKFSGKCNLWFLSQPEFNYETKCLEKKEKNSFLIYNTSAWGPSKEELEYDYIHKKYITETKNNWYIYTSWDSCTKYRIAYIESPWKDFTLSLFFSSSNCSNLVNKTIDSNDIYNNLVKIIIENIKF